MMGEDRERRAHISALHPNRPAAISRGLAPNEEVAMPRRHRLRT